MKYLLDSNVCIQYLNQRSEKIIQRLQDLSDIDIIVCSIVKAELFYGAILWCNENS
jgi:tRNA(fMet)-specific endonuclease VapC